MQTVDIAPDMPRGEIHVPEAYREMLQFYCDEAGVPYALMARVIQEESGWNPKANNKKGDLGICQLNQIYLEYYGWRFNDGFVVDPFNPEISIKVACRYMRHLYLLCHDYRVATMAYNCGYHKLIIDGPPRSTLDYVSRVFGFTFD